MANIDKLPYLKIDKVDKENRVFSDKYSLMLWSHWARTLGITEGITGRLIFIPDEVIKDGK